MYSQSGVLQSAGVPSGDLQVSHHRFGGRSCTHSPGACGLRAYRLEANRSHTIDLGAGHILTVRGPAVWGRTVWGPTGLTPGLIVSPEEHVRSQRNGRNIVGARGKDGRTDGRTEGLAGRTDVSGGRGTQVRIHREWPGWLDGRMCKEAEEQVKRHRESHGRTGTKDGKTQGRAFGRADGRTGGPSGAREGGMSGPRGRCQD